MEINIHQLPPSFNFTKNYLEKITRLVSKELELNAISITCIFVNDKHLAEMHKQYLNDSDKTDVITFNLGEEKIEGEIYMSYERAVDQAGIYKVSTEEEIVRLLIHGLLHLAGYDDLNDKDRQIMKERENQLVDKYSVVN